MKAFNTGLIPSHYLSPNPPRSLNAYIQDFVSQLGGVFDTLLSFVIGGAALIPVANNVTAFEAFITVNDASQHVPNNALYAAYPQTVQQILAAF